LLTSTPSLVPVVVEPNLPTQRLTGLDRLEVAFPHLGHTHGS